MTGAMYSAVAGLKTHMQALNVIGNNVANVNTNGYKAGRYVFQSALYTSLRGGSNGSVTVGGKNPSQIGYGSSISSVDINMGTSNYVPTGKPTDCMIDGDGFFLTGRKGMTFENAQDFKSFTLTRVGDIEFKADGYLCKPDGNVVYGFKCLGFAADGKTPVVSNQLQGICKPRITVDGQVVYTEEQYIAMRAAALGGDNAGNAGNADEETAVEGWPAAFEELSFAGFDSISIDEGTGKISGIISDTDQNITIGFIAIGTVDNPNGVSQETGTYYRCGDGAGEMYISMLGGAGQTVYDSSNFTFIARTEIVNEQTGETVVTPAHWQTLTEIEVPGEDADAAAIAAYKEAIAALRLNYVNGGARPADGEEEPYIPPDSMKLHTGGTTKLITNGLEQTDTDLATEISNMIMIQRGYQANTRIVTVTDSMLEELVNMKR